MRFPTDAMKTLTVSLVCCGLQNAALAQQAGLDCAYGQNLGMHQLDAAPTCTAISGSVAFFGSNQGVIAYDLSNPSAPVELDSLATSTPAYLVPSGDELIMGMGSGGATLGIVDISDPSNMTLLSDYTNGSLDRIEAVARDGHVLFVGSGNGTVMALNISNPSHPTAIQTYNFGDPVKSLEIEGDRLYMASNQDGVEVYDISNPSSISLIGSFGPTDATGVEVDSQIAYVLDQDFGFRVYDCSNLAAVSQIAAVELEKPHQFYAHSVYRHQLVGDRYYVRDAKYFAYDVTDPSNPVEAGDIETPYVGFQIEHYGAFATDIAVRTTASPEHGFEVFDVSTMYHAPVGETIYESGVVNEAGYLFKFRSLNFPTPHYSLQAFDISNPQSPLAIDEYDPMYDNRGLMVPFGDYLLVSNSGMEMQVLDASNPTNLQQVASLTIGDGLAFQGGVFSVGDDDLVALWATQYGKVQFADLSDPMNPTILGEYDFGSGEANEVKKVVVQDGYAYISLYSKEIAVIDLTNPSAPVEVGRVVDPQIPNRNMLLAASSGYLYVASENLILAYSMQNPASPLFVDDFVLGDSVHFPISFHAHGDKLYLTVDSWATPVDYDRVPTLTAFDISDPTMITVAGGTTPMLIASAAQFLDGVAYLDSGSQLLPVTLSFGCTACPADLNGDGALDFFDVSAFLNAFSQGDLSADMDGNGSLDFFDVSAFLNAFGAGCP